MAVSVRRQNKEGLNMLKRCSNCNRCFKNGETRYILDDGRTICVSCKSEIKNNENKQDNYCFFHETLLDIDRCNEKENNEKIQVYCKQCGRIMNYDYYVFNNDILCKTCYMIASAENYHEGY